MVRRIDDKRLERLLVRQEGGAPVVTNSFGVTIKTLWLTTLDGRVWTATSLGEGKETRLQPATIASPGKVEALRDVVGAPPQLATAERLDAIGAATRRLEQELDPAGPSPFAAALKSAQGAVSELQREVEAGYLVDLEA